MGNQKGFSLLELLVVVAIIAILAAIAIPLMRDAIVRAHISAAATDAKAIYVAFKRHHVDMSMYPYASNDPAFQLDSFEPLVSSNSSISCMNFQPTLELYQEFVADSSKVRTRLPSGPSQEASGNGSRSCKWALRRS